MKPVITKECAKTLFESKYIKVYDLQYAEGKHYYDATRRDAGELMAVKSDEEFKNSLPDAVTCVLIIKSNDGPKLLLQREYRYPAGRFLLSPPAGLLDKEDAETAEPGDYTPVITAAKREISEETGLEVTEEDDIYVIDPFLFSTPGMTDESNGLVCAVLGHHDISELSNAGAVGTELFDGFVMLSEDEAKETLKRGRDNCDIFYSVYTWAALMYFVSGMWK